MKKQTLLKVGLFLTVLGAPFLMNAQQKEIAYPNIIHIVMNDVGYDDLNVI